VPKTKATQVDDVFRELLRELRLAKNLTQTQVAERLGLPQSYVSKYETGEQSRHLLGGGRKGGG
jgi:transcriptional regulator with XRE-family HTH domain